MTFLMGIKHENFEKLFLKLLWKWIPFLAVYSVSITAMLSDYSGTPRLEDVSTTKSCLYFIRGPPGARIYYLSVKSVPEIAYYVCALI